MVCTPAPLIAKSIAFGPVVLSDWVMAHRRVPVAVVSAVLVTVKVDSISRPSSGSTMNRRRRSGRRRAEQTLRRLRNQRFAIGSHPQNKADGEREARRVTTGPPAALPARMDLAGRESGSGRCEGGRSTVPASASTVWVLPDGPAIRQSGRGLQCGGHAIAARSAIRRVRAATRQSVRRTDGPWGLDGDSMATRERDPRPTIVDGSLAGTTGASGRVAPGITPWSSHRSGRAR